MLKGGLGPPDPLKKKAFPEAAAIIMTTNEAQKGVASIFSERGGAVVQAAASNKQLIQSAHDQAPKMTITEDQK